MQIAIEPKGVKGHFDSSLGSFVAHVENGDRREGGFIAEVDTDDVFVVGVNIFILGSPRDPSISVVDGINVIVGVISERFDNQTAVLKIKHQNACPFIH